MLLCVLICPHFLRQAGVTIAGFSSAVNQASAVGMEREAIKDRQKTHQQKIYSIEIAMKHLENVRRTSTEDLGFPLLEEYDFRRDSASADLPIALRSAARHRPYQEKSLSKMFGNSRARSGIIVLPCGAGKTLVGITAATTIKKSCLVICSTSVAVHQWKREFMRYL